MINKIDFTAKNLTSNAGLFLLLENAKSNEIFDLVERPIINWTVRVATYQFQFLR